MHAKTKLSKIVSLHLAITFLIELSENAFAVALLRFPHGFIVMFMVIILMKTSRLIRVATLEESENGAALF